MRSDFSQNKAFEQGAGGGFLTGKGRMQRQYGAHEAGLTAQNAVDTRAGGDVAGGAVAVAQGILA